MAFKSEIHVAELASIRTGHTEGDIYYILDNGMLGDLPCKPGTFVKWHNGAWQIQPDEHYALASAVDGEIAQAIDNALDDGSASKTIVVAVPSSQSGNYTVGDYYEVQGKVAKLRAKTEGDNVTHLTFDTTSGILEAINSSSGKIAVFECSDNGSDQNFFTGPTYDELEGTRLAGKTIVLLVHYGFDTIVDRYFEMTFYGIGRGSFRYKFTGEEGRVLQFSGTVGDAEHYAWSRASAYDSTLSSTSANAVQNSTLYAVIGDVETLLAAL